jgi:hypothetical protein
LPDCLLYVVFYSTACNEHMIVVHTTIDDDCGTTVVRF